MNLVNMAQEVNVGEGVVGFLLFGSRHGADGLASRTNADRHTQPYEGCDKSDARERTGLWMNLRPCVS